MKSILIIGMGRFGRYLCENLAERGNEIMIVDEVEETMEDLLPIVTSAKIGDCTNPDVLKSLGISNFDMCIICIGTNFQSSLEVTSLVKEMGAKYVISKANRDIQAKFLLRNGADEIIYPDRDIAERLAVKYSAKNIFDYVELSAEYSIYEIPTLKDWVGKTIREVNIRATHSINILGLKIDGIANFMPSADYVFSGREHMVILGKNEDVSKLLSMIK